MERLTDLRFVIGIFFMFAGLIVLISSFTGDGGKMHGAQINMYAGIAYMIFGFGMWYSSRKPVG